jgi:hypothetical protein
LTHGTVATKDLKTRGKSGESVSIQQHFGGFMVTEAVLFRPERREGAERLVIVDVLVFHIGCGWEDGHTLFTRVLRNIGKAPSRWLASRTNDWGIRRPSVGSIQGAFHGRLLFFVLDIRGRW